MIPGSSPGSPVPPPPGEGPFVPRRRVGAVLAIILGCLVVLVAAIWGALWFIDTVDDSLDEVANRALVTDPPAALEEKLPPSERDRLGAQEQGVQIGQEPDDNTFTELSCTFSGQSNLDPPLSLTVPSASPTVMTLSPGSRFDCTDNLESSSGAVALDATFPELTLSSGVAAGTGRIDWETIGLSQQQPGSDPLPSATEVEIELDRSVIVVWTHIVDGPYSGYRGRLVLREWEPLFDDDAQITGVRFANTSTVFKRG